ncbi:hypothetical protein BGZ88_010555 [Linnemannia elongata]|nr:hypothetical protein BGZ88_010555 [Linnemannia elongata]
MTQIITITAPKQSFMYGEETKSLQVRHDQEGQYFYNRLDDILHAFDGAKQFGVGEFRVGGEPIPFLVSDNEQRHDPPRISHYPNDIVEISTAVRSPDPSYSSDSIIIKEIHTGFGISAETSLPPSASLSSSSSRSCAAANTVGKNIAVRPPSPHLSPAQSQPPVLDCVLPALNMVSFSRLMEAATDKTDISQHLPRTSSLAPESTSATATANVDTPLSRSNSTQRRVPERPPRLRPVQARPQHSPSSSVSSSVSYSSQSSGATTLTSSSISPPAPLLPPLPTPLSSLSVENSKRFSVISNDASGLKSELVYINNLINAAQDRKSEYFRELLRYYGILLGQEQHVFEERLSSQNLPHLHNHNPQYRTGPKKDIMERRLDAILVQSREIHECSIPRFFVLLPETFGSFDSKSLKLEQCRLYFLCECEAHSSGQSHRKSRSPSSPTSPTSPSFSRRRVHLHTHSSYAISRPNDFLKWYGSYILGMLKVLSHCLRTGTVAHETSHDAMSGVDSIPNATLANVVSGSISFLRQTLEESGITPPLPTTSPEGLQQQDGPLPNVAALESADLRRLTTFLQHNDGDRILGNLYRITTGEGYIKWVCHEHYEQSLRGTTMDSFLRILQGINGTHDPHLRKVTISLKSSADSRTFFEAFSRQASDVDELDVVFDGWSFWSRDLESLVKSVCQSNVKSLKLDLKDSVNDPICEFGARITPGSKYQALFELLWNRNLQGLSLSGAGAFGFRTSDFEMGPHFSYLQSFHFLHAINTSDQLRLMKLLAYCSNLKDLRLGDYVNPSGIRQQMVSVIAAMEHLRTLHLYRVEGKCERPVSGLLEAFTKKATPLKELVCYVGRVDEWELGEVIKSLSGTLEVLVVEQVSPPNLDLVPVITDSSPTGSSGASFQRQFTSMPLPSPFSRLTYLDLNANLSPQSMNYLAGTLKSLNLSISLLGFDVDGMKPLKVYVQNCNNPTHLEVISLQGCKYANPWKFAPLLKSLTLRRLQLSGLSSPELKGMMGVMKLSRLECLILVECHYDWTVEEALARKRADFRPELMLHLSIASSEVSHQQVEEKGVDKVESREAVDTAVKLAARRVRIYSETQLLLLSKPLLGIF